MTARKSAPKAEPVAPEAGSAEGPPEEPAAPEEVQVAPLSAPAPPHPVKRYQIAPSAHLGTRAGGYVLTERGWVLDTTPGQEQ